VRPLKGERERCRSSGRAGRKQSDHGAEHDPGKRQLPATPPDERPPVLDQQGSTLHAYPGRLTVTVNRAVPEFALLSVASQRTVVLPIGKRLPDFGAHAAGTVPSPSSRAVT
jgi:hypothetical protein